MDLHAKLDALLDKLAPTIAKAFREAVQDIVDNTVLQQVIDAVKAGDTDAAFRALGYTPPAFNPVITSIFEAFVAGGNAVVGSLPRFIQDSFGVKQVLRFDVRDREAEDFLRRQSSMLITAIEEDTRNNIRNTMQAGLAEGRNPRNVALDIVGRINPSTGHRQGGVVGLGHREEQWSRAARTKLVALDQSYFELELRDKRFDSVVKTAIEKGEPLPASVVDKLVLRYRDNALKHRGETIARSETLAALNQSEYLSLKQAVERAGLPPEAVERYWDSSGDNRVRHSHRELDGQKVIGLNTPFVSPVTGAKMLYPGDRSLGAGGNETIACRCRVRTRIDFITGAT